MVPTITVSADSMQVPGLESVVASLPLSLRFADGLGEATAIDGASGWVDRAVTAIQGGSRAIVVTGPVAMDVSSLTRLADSTGATVIIDSRWASNAVVPHAAAEIRRVPTTENKLQIHSVISVHDPLDVALLDQLALARALVGNVKSLRVVYQGQHGYYAQVACEERGVNLVVVQSVGEHAHTTARVVTQTGSIDVDIPCPDTARPATMYITDAAGSTLKPTVYESAHRTAWRKLIGAHASPDEDLAAFATHTKVAQALAK